MSTLDIEAIKVRLAAATPGPWDIGTTTDCSGDTAILAEIRGETTVIAECFAEFIGKDGVVAKNSQRCLATATLIAHAPADIAALLAEVEALDKLVAADAKVRAAASALLAILQEPVWGRNNWGIRKTDAMAALDAALNG